MTERLTGSTAGSAFEDALALLAAHPPADRRGRVPFDYRPAAATAAAWSPSASRVPHHAVGPIADAARALRRREVSARELVEASLAAAAANEDLGGIAHLDPEGARARAAEIDVELTTGRDRGPLHGVPVTVKDVIDVAGMPTAAGSVAYADRPETDAVGVARWRAAGAVVVGKATTHEFALGVTTPQSRNPHAPDRIPGGSSGGSAICVVRRIGLGSLGTDTRASIRVPAALCGIVGFKPTYGTIPTTGLVSLAWTMDHVAPLATTVSDAALLLDALLGEGSQLAWAPDTMPRGLRVGVAPSGFVGAEPGVAAAVDAALGTIEELGGRLAVAPTPSSDDLDLANAAGLVVSRCEAAAAHRSLRLDRSRYWQEVDEQLDHAERVLAVDYLDAQRLRAELRDRLLAVFDEHDVIAMPTVPVVAPPVEDFAQYLMLLSRNAIPWSFVGFPAISVPVGPAGALPVGLQLVAPPGGEATLVQVGSALERARAG
jgi:aspartyl-tRNA(Asn)/glutamyl-tRNA(Gln) amidotransferase subunit A